MSEKTSASFDFASDEARTKDTATLTVKHPKKGELDVRIEIAGRDSELYQGEYARFRKQTVKTISDSKDNEPSEKETRQIVARFLSRITISWENVSYDGKPLECSEPNAFKLYNDPSLRWLSDQVDDFARDRRNFLGN